MDIRTVQVGWRLVVGGWWSVVDRWLVEGKSFGRWLVAGGRWSMMVGRFVIRPFYKSYKKVTNTQEF